MHSMSTTLFTFLQAFVLGGGAPELAPFVCVPERLWTVRTR